MSKRYRSNPLAIAIANYVKVVEDMRVNNPFIEKEDAE